MNNSSKILICGSRNWHDRDKIIERFKTISTNSIIIHGGCNGADSISGEIASSLGISVMCYPANWKEFGRSAGPRRNQQMLDEGKPDLVIVFHEDLQNSRGTLDMMKRAKKSGVIIEIIS